MSAFEDESHAPLSAANTQGSPTSVLDYHNVAPRKRLRAQETPSLSLPVDSAALEDQQRSNKILSLLIWEQRWEEARERLLEFPDEAQEEVELPCFNTGTCYALPLHLACAMRPLPPASFVQVLLEVYPEAAQVKEETWGMLPLHWAADLRQKTVRPHRKEDDDTVDSVPDISEDNNDANNHATTMDPYDHGKIVEMLLLAYPEALRIRETFNGMLPLHISASTAKSQHGFVSPSSYIVLAILLAYAPETEDEVDGRGDTPINLAWRETRFNCAECQEKADNEDNDFCPHIKADQEGLLNPLLRLNIVRGEDANNLHCRHRSNEEQETRNASALIQGSDQQLRVDSSCENSSTEGSQEISEISDARTSIFSDMPEFSGLHLEILNGLFLTPGIFPSTVSMKIKLHASKLKLQGKRRKKPNPFFEVLLLRGLSNKEFLYRSYPIMRRREATWDEVEIDLGVSMEIACHLALQVSVYHCEGKGQMHPNIGTFQSGIRHIEECRLLSLPLRRGFKVTGELRILEFELKEVSNEI